jgi:hypothetical protein
MLTKNRTEITKGENLNMLVFQREGRNYIFG